MKFRAVVLIIAVAACSRKSQPATDTGVASRDTAATRTAAPSGRPDTIAGLDSATRAKSAAERATTGARQTTSSAKAPVASARDTLSSAKASAPSALDTLRGAVAVTGTERDRHIVIKPAVGGRSVELHGPAVADVERAAGADVLVRGTREGSAGFVVESFTVRTVDGAPAVDGRLAIKGSQLVVITPDGVPHPIEHAPPALRQHVGARVWVSGDLSRAPAAWGIISEKP